MADIKKWKHYAKSRYGQVHFVTAKPVDERAIKHPPLVCFHPSPTSGDMFRDLQMILARDRVVYCPDTPGFGSSDGPTTEPTMADYGAGLADALLDMGYSATNKVDIFGFHTGSLCALEVAVQHPEIINKTVLSGVPHYTPEGRAEQHKIISGGYPMLTNPDYVGTMYKRLVLDGSEAGELEQRYYRFVNRLRAGPKGWWGINAVFTMDTAAALPKLKMPVLLIAFNEMMLQPTRDAAKIIPDVRMVELLDLPMFGFITAPDKVAAEVQKFLG
ncbi:MAG: alpha/beta hydrolase [Rhodospirillaceae bacterium]|nr:alpha/beta hydrolase [Rhodospirillaceae bacterium]